MAQISKSEKCDSEVHSDGPSWLTSHLAQGVTLARVLKPVNNFCYHTHETEGLKS